MITSTANPKIKRLVQLQKKSRLRNEEGVFIVEGTRMFIEIPREYLLEVYVSESFESREIKMIKAREVPVEVLEERVFNHVSDTKSPQGVLCVVRRPVYHLEALLNNPDPCLLFLDNLQDPGNLGTIIRTAEGAGVTGVVLSAGCVDIYSPKTIRSTMGSIFRVPFVYQSEMAAVIRQVQAAGVQVYAAHLAGEVDYDQADYCGGTAFLLGNEGNGLPDELTGLADQLIRIPMRGQLESLNVATAATILMFETARQRRY